jgi:hypothetical protein
LAIYSFGPEDGWNTSIEILAWADFNGDGLEDVFMLEGPSIFILTRYSETAVLIHTDQEPVDYLSRCG